MKSAKKLLSIILTAVILLGSVSAISIISSAVEIPSGTHYHDGILFEPWTSTDSLPDEEATSGAVSYYLVNDVTLSSTWYVPKGEFNICLDGHSIRLCSEDEGDCVIGFTIGNWSVLRIFDKEDNSGTITGGYCGIDMNTGKLVLNGGTITGNNCTAGSGGGVFVFNAIFEMNGGVICGNNASTNAGGVYVGDGSTFTMNGGKICDNYAGNNGGAIWVLGSTMEMNGGEISGNTAKKKNGGINLVDATLRVSGSPVIKGNKVNGAENNINLYKSEKIIEISGKLNNDAQIGVHSTVEGVITSGLSQYGTASNFFADNSKEFHITTDNNGEAYLQQHVKGTMKVENITAPTCTSAGSRDEVYYCTECGEEISRTTVEVPALSHTDNDGDGRCDDCSAVMSSADSCPICGKVHTGGNIADILARFIHTMIYNIKSVFSIIVSVVFKG